jgi:hypothetical protein
MKFGLVIGAYLMVGNASVNAAQPLTTTQVYVGISLNKKLDPNSAFVAPGPFLTTYFDRLFTHLGGHAKNNLHMTFYQGTAAKVSCYATPQRGQVQKNIKCYATGEDITPQERADLNTRLKATYHLTLNTLHPANGLMVNLDLKPRYRESTADKYFVMLDFDTDTTRNLLTALNVFRLFLGHKNHDINEGLPGELTQFPLEEDIQKLSDQSRAKIDHFKATSPNLRSLQYVNIIKNGSEVSPNAPICCHQPGQNPANGCLDMQESIVSVNPENVQCYILGAKKWYTGAKEPSSHVTLIDHTIVANKETLKTLIGSKVKYATQVTKSLALTNIAGTNWTKVPDNVIKGALYMTLTHNLLCDSNQTVIRSTKDRLEKILPTEKKNPAKNYMGYWTQACRTANFARLFNATNHLKEYGQYRPDWDNYPGHPSALFTNFSQVTNWLIENKVKFDLKELDFHD